VKIALFCNWKLKFAGHLKRWWEERGHEVRYKLGYDPALHEWADVCFIDVCDNNAIQGTKRSFPGSFLAVRCIDIECWCRQPRGITWENVDAAFFGARHIMELVQEDVKRDIADKCYHAPFGVDMRDWTFRERDGRGGKIALICHRWPAKGLQLAVQAMAVLPGWELHVLGDRNRTRWFHRYWDWIVAETGIGDRVFETEERVPDLDAWLEDKDFVLGTSMKEAFGYTYAESAAKGIRPLIHNFWRATDIWPEAWVWNTLDDLLEMVEGCLACYDSAGYRDFIARNYSLARMMERIDAICGIS